MTDRNGRLVHYERLLLPFAADGHSVDRILASYEFICVDGAFDGRELMQTQSAPPTLRLSATDRAGGSGIISQSFRGATATAFALAGIRRHVTRPAPLH